MSQTLNIYSLYDRKACSYGLPFVSINDQIATRMCRTAVNDERTGDISAYPEDYSLYRVGSFCDSTGIITPESPGFICILATLRDVIPQESGEGCRGETSPSARASTVDVSISAPDEPKVELPVLDVRTALNAKGEAVNIACSE